MRTDLIIHLMAGAIITLSILIGVLVAKESCRRNAMLNEYEYLLADVWTENMKCQDQLGVFYVEPE